MTDVAQNVVDAFSLDGMRELLVDNPGKFSHESVSFVPNFTTRFLVWVTFLISKQDLILGEASTDQFEFADRTDPRSIRCI